MHAAVLRCLPLYAVAGMRQCSAMGGQVAARGKRMLYVPPCRRLLAVVQNISVQYSIVQLHTVQYSPVHTTAEGRNLVVEDCCAEIASLLVLLLSPAGRIGKIRLLGDLQHSTRIAFIEFIDAEAAMAALNCSGALLGECSLVSQQGGKLAGGSGKAGGYLVWCRVTVLCVTVSSGQYCVCSCYSCICLAGMRLSKC